MSVISRKTKRWDRSGVCLGGIGAGKIEFCPSGRFSNIMSQNNWDAPIVTYGPVDKPRDYDAEGLRGAFLAVYVEGAGAKVLKEAAREPMVGLKPGQIRYEGMFPRANVSYPAMAGVELSLEAFSSLDLASDGRDRYKDSSIPAAAFVMRLRNTTRRARKVSVMMSWPNLVGQGGYFERMVNDVRNGEMSLRFKGKRAGIFFTHVKPKVDPRVEGNWTLLTENTAGRKISWIGWDWTGRSGPENTPLVWEYFNRDGSTPPPPEPAGWPWWMMPAAALNVSLTVRPGAAVEVPFVLGWYFPNLVATRNAKADYGHAYQNWFDSSWDAADYLLTDRRRLLAKTRAWQQALEASNLPEWLVEKLINDLFALVAGSWYTKDYTYTVNESPTDMGGCHGTIDQRAASSAIVDMCFPRLSKSELSLFAGQQIGPKHKDRFGKHWDMKKGGFGKRLDRAGAIRHDVGWDDLEGGNYGPSRWLNLHWPDLTSVFVLECWRYAAWAGDRAFFKSVYPRVKAALEFQTRLDQNGDGVADLWGHASNTYDSPQVPMYGASTFVTTLFLAANLCAEEMAKLMGDEAFARTCRRRFARARKTLDQTLWDPKLKTFVNWVDTHWKAWKGKEREHGARSDQSMSSALAGQWFSNLLGFAPVTDDARLQGTLKTIYDLNVSLPKYCLSIFADRKGWFNFSWPQYGEVYYAANAMYEGRVDEGIEAVRKIYNAQYLKDGSPWDAPLLYDGKGNGEYGWGRYYMTNPASWFLLNAITGVGVDHLRGMLAVSPNIPKAIGGGKTLSAVPVFFPNFRATVNASLGKRSRRLSLKVTQLVGEKPVAFKTLRVLDTGKTPTVKLGGKTLRVRSAAKAGKFLDLAVSVRFARPGDRLEIVG